MACKTETVFYSSSHPLEFPIVRISLLEFSFSIALVNDFSHMYSFSSSSLETMTCTVKKCNPLSAIKGKSVVGCMGRHMLFLIMNYFRY